MRKLIKRLDEVLGKLDLTKNETVNVYNLDTDQGVTDWLSFMKRINYIERQIFDLMTEILENEQRVKVEEDNRCGKCED